MIKHIVMWKIKESHNGQSKAEMEDEIIRRVHALRGKVEGTIELEAGRDFSRGDKSYDVALYSAFRDRQALNDYQVFPEHVELKNYITGAAAERVVVDYEI